MRYLLIMLLKSSIIKKRGHPQGQPLFSNLKRLDYFT